MTIGKNIFKGLITASFAAAITILSLAGTSKFLNQNVTMKNSNSAQLQTIPQSDNNHTPSSVTTVSNNSGNSAQQSISDVTSNWAGYVSSGGTYTTVSGSWVVPAVSAGNDTASADATWIGIGGVSSDDLIQIGTQNVVEDGQVNTTGFFEQLPNSSVSLPEIDVNAGDTITANIAETSNGEWTVSIKDITNGESYSNIVDYNSSQSSAEWIEEAPSDQSSVIPLDQFGSITFTNAMSTENGNEVNLSNSNAQSLQMDNDEGEALTGTSAIDSSGAGFTVSRTSASGDISSQFSGIPEGWSRHEPGIGRHF
jgi:hypothetical protein